MATCGGKRKKEERKDEAKVREGCPLFVRVRMAASLLFLAFLLWPSPSHGLSSTPRVVAFVRQRSASALEAHAEHEHDVVGDDGAVDSASTSEQSPPNAFEKTVRS
ncbi:hypothetical protein THAOC_24690, partial [Thalassiosira oceanica]